MLASATRHTLGLGEENGKNETKAQSVAAYAAGNANLTTVLAAVTAADLAGALGPDFNGTGEQCEDGP
jgi:hypothetical protein